MKRIARRIQATQDIDKAIDHYIDVANFDLAERLVSEIALALSHIGRHPGTGSPRYANLGGEVGVRFWTLDQFPYAVFYVERTEVIEILRVLHLACDIPAHLDP